MEPHEAIRKNARASVQAQVEAYLLGQIESESWPVGAKIPSERDLATALDVSRTTVRNAVLALTNRGLFERSVGQGTFVRRSSRPQGAAHVSRGTLGYVVCKERSDRRPIAAEAFYFEVFLGIEEETARSGRHTLFSYLDDFDEQEIAALHGFLEKVDGIIVEEARNPALFDTLRSNGIPTVLLAPTVAIQGLDLVTADLAEGARTAVHCLRDLGHRRVAIINGPLRLDSARIRFQAWKDAMTEGGIAPEPRFIDGNEGWSAEAGYDAMNRLLTRNPDLTAVFCANDLLAIGALSALAEHAIRVPEDVSVIGFDDSELARHSSPPLSTMRIHSHEMGRTAARRLLERIENPDLPTVTIEFPIDLIQRSSCKEAKQQE